MTMYDFMALGKRGRINKKKASYDTFLSRLTSSRSLASFH